MARAAVDRVEHMRAAIARLVALGAEHEALQDDARLALEQLGQFDALGPLIRPDPFEAVILGHVAAGRQRAALRRDRLDLAAERDLGVEQRDPRAAIFGAFIGERSEEPTSELQSLMRISYAVFCLKKK